MGSDDPGLGEARANTALLLGATLADLGQQSSNALTPRQAERAAKAALKKEKQQHNLRQRLFNWAMKVAATALFLNFGVFVLYMISQWGDIAPAVMVSWISATVVEVLGLVYLIARYLFSATPSPILDGTTGSAEPAAS